MALSNTIMWVSAKPPFSISKILKPFCPKSHAQVSILNLYQPQLSIEVLYDINERKGGFRQQEGKGVDTSWGEVAEQVGLVGGGVY
ncbi:hypothetical protein L3X38_005945 [Prunus dulcis]|uniref:Uncharacterized protein n=1 Tax=Prunus dulcis TaxID=3755 RepID=A0AAD4ZRR1_PRUDU|nr:hypothetical protein L3X38_005945 [Prunus dulcis]